MWRGGLADHGAADVVEQLDPGRVDELGLLVRAVVSPEDDVPQLVGRCSRVVPRSGSDRDWLASLEVSDRERARRVEPDPLDEGRVNIGLPQNVLAGLGDTVPDCEGKRGLSARGSQAGRMWFCLL